MTVPGTVTVNGTGHELPDPPTVEALLARALDPPGCTGIAVAVNGTVVPRDRHADHVLAPGDRVEVVRAVQGG